MGDGMGAWGSRRVVDRLPETDWPGWLRAGGLWAQWPRCLELLQLSYFLAWTRGRPVPLWTSACFLL